METEMSTAPGVVYPEFADILTNGELYLNFFQKELPFQDSVG